MFLHTHPYAPFLYPEATKLIVGTLPPPRFTTGELREGDVDFCYGSRDGQLWTILDRLFDLKLKFETTREAIDQRVSFLKERGLAICDIVASAERERMDASDVGMRNVKLRNLIAYLRHYPNLDTLLFMGGNSKNGPEYFFRKLLSEHGLKWQRVSNEVPRIHTFKLPPQGRTIKAVTLIAPSGAANRAVGSLESYKRRKLTDPDFTVLDFRVGQYRPFF